VPYLLPAQFFSVTVHKGGRAVIFGYFIPDIIFKNVYDIDFNELKEKNNIKGIIFDIDNTLVSYRQENPTKNVCELMDKLKNDGFFICFISNNTKKRVDIFNERFKFFSFPKAGKPFTSCIKKALKIMEITEKNAVLVGDQLFTDIAAAKKAKIMAILVEPIEPAKTLFFKFKRFMEKPFIKRYYKKSGNNLCK